MVAPTHPKDDQDGKVVVQGIFCTNFYWTVGGYTACRSTWCGEFYTSSQETKFHIPKGPIDEGASVVNQTDQARLIQAWGKRVQLESDYLHAKSRDHTLVPFECDRCIFLCPRQTFIGLHPADEPRLFLEQNHEDRRWSLRKTGAWNTPVHQDSWLREPVHS